jgi:hypothetical protein
MSTGPSQPPGAIAARRSTGRSPRRTGQAGLGAGLGGLLGAVVLMAGCDSGKPGLPPEALVVTQVPVGITARATGESDVLDSRYPPGSRVVVVPRPEVPGDVRVLSRGLLAAGDPVLDPEAREVLFVGKRAEKESWQIYRVPLNGRRAPEAVTDMAGGARDPAWMPAGRFVFSAPVPSTPSLAGGERIMALYSQAVTGGPPHRLTHGVASATDPTVLADGRILFVSATPVDSKPYPQSLFTINNDGTEVSPFAGQHDGPAALRRPRETADGRLLFLAAGVGTPVLEGRIEAVRLARPFRSRTVVMPPVSLPCRSAESLPTGEILGAFGPDGSAGIGPTTFAVYRYLDGAGATGMPGTPMFDDPGWHDVEAQSARPVRRFMGRLSSVDPGRRDGMLLGLDVNRSDRPFAAGGRRMSGGRIRVARHEVGAAGEVLGEVPVCADGSFLASVPADVALSFELVAADGTVVERCPPASWVRPGENRSCIGCHEPHNHATENFRPLAVRQPPVRLPGRARGSHGREGKP